jgi:hypothetical protein
MRPLICPVAETDGTGLVLGPVILLFSDLHPKKKIARSKNIEIL